MSTHHTVAARCVSCTTWSSHAQRRCPLVFLSTTSVTVRTVFLGCICPYCLLQNATRILSHEQTHLVFLFYICGLTRHVCPMLCVGVDVHAAGVPDLAQVRNMTSPAKGGSGNTASVSQQQISPTLAAVLAEKLHSSLLYSVDMMGVGGNVPALTGGSDDSTALGIGRALSH